MTGGLAALVPSLVVFGVAVLVLIGVIWGVRRARRGPAARARAEQMRVDAGGRLVRLDDAVAELDLEAALSGALYGGDAPHSLRRARITAQHARDDAFEIYREISEPDTLPIDVRHGAGQIRTLADRALSAIARARADHEAWVGANVSAARQVASASDRLAALRDSMGDPTALVAELSARFDDDEWQEAADAATGALSAAAEAERLLAEAAAAAADPSQSALSALAQAERALRTAKERSRSLEEIYRLVTQAALAAPDEIASARDAVRQAESVRAALEATDAERLGAAVREASDAIDAIEGVAPRRPTDAVTRLARVRDRLDMALGDARTAQQRLRGARTALPGTLAAARNALAHAEAAVSRVRSGADARVRLAAAEEELAAARQAADPVGALDAARRAIRHAEDAKALADYAVMHR